MEYISFSFYNEGSGGCYNLSSRYEYDPDSHELVFVESYFTLDASETSIDTEGILVCYTNNEDCVLSSDIDDPDIEVIGNYADGCPFYEEYGIHEEDMYVYQDMIMLYDYAQVV